MVLSDSMDFDPNKSRRVVLRDENRGKWLNFSSPCRILTTRRVGDVVSLVRMIEEATQRDGLYAAGFISYEAAPAFDPSLSVKDDGKFPMLWFGLFERVEELELLPNAAASPPSVRWHPSVEPEEYRRCVHKIHEFIQNGDTYQVNFTYRLNAKTSVDPWRLFTDIAGNGEAPFAAFVDTGDWAVCSASPELFLRLDGENMESRPMKGTAARGLWFEDDRKKRKELRNSEKERAENVMITDMVRNDLGRVAMGGSVHVSSLFEIEKYPTVWQMTSTVRARTHEPLDRILKAAFPPASITGAPKCRTMEIIRDLESSPRRIYTGTVGFVTPGRYAQFNVAIRTVLLNKKTGHAEYGVGGGIVWDSKSPAEYEECLTKTKVLNPSARNFDLIETMLWTPQDGYPFLYYHLRRLARSADYFGFKVDLHKIRNKLSDVASGLALEPHRVRLLVSRCGKIKCEATPVGSASMDFGRVTLAESPIDRGDIFMYHKTTRRHVYEDAVAMSPESDDVLLFNEAGQITESTIANIALEIDGMFYTPPVSCGLLPGTRRAWMLDRAGLLERVISVGEVLESPNVYLMNSVRGMHKINIDTSGGPMASNRES